VRGGYAMSSEIRSLPHDNLLRCVTIASWIKFFLRTRPFEVEHVVPTSKDGSDDDSNLALACRACNLRKLDHLSGFDGMTQTEVPLFDPRRHRWDDHFQLSFEDGEIRVTTALGRAT